MLVALAVLGPAPAADLGFDTESERVTGPLERSAASSRSRSIRFFSSSDTGGGEGGRSDLRFLAERELELRDERESLSLPESEPEELPSSPSSRSRRLCTGNEEKVRGRRGGGEVGWLVGKGWRSGERTSFCDPFASRRIDLFAGCH